MAPENLDNELTPVAEFVWKIYTQLIRAGFERPDALYISIELLKSMTNVAINSK